MEFNPTFPDVLGNEWLITHDQKTRVWGGANARALRRHSTATETITQLKMSATVDPLATDTVPTLVDVCVEGNEFTAIPKVARLIPNSDNVNEGWTRSDGSATSLFLFVDDPTNKWPSPNTNTINQWARTFVPQTAYACGVNAALFNGGAAASGRVFWVGVGAIFMANTGFRKLGLALMIDGLLYPPAAGGIRDVHAYGQKYEFWWGEINPATHLPWTPADIAKFDTDPDWGIFVRSQASATSAKYPKIMSLSLNVAYLETENRAAVGVYNRPEEVGQARLLNVATEALRTMPAGTANWAKATGQRYTFFWRQSVSPSEYGAVLGDDLRWNGCYQDLGSSGNPPGPVFPLYHDGTAPAPTTVMASDIKAHDQYGRPQDVWSADSRAGYALAMVRNDAAISVDSQPYRLDLDDIEQVTVAQKLGQRLVPGSTQTYLGVRFPIIPPASGTATLTVEVRRVSDNLLMGGAFTITAAQVRALINPLVATARSTAGSPWGYVSGFLASGATLIGGTAYELRFSTDAGTWLMAMPDCSLAPTASFGGSTSGAFIGATHDTNRDLSANLVRQPDPPTAVTATLTNVPITTYLSEVGLPFVQHVRVAFVAPAVGLGAVFKRYELERSLDAQVTWQRIANINNSATLSFMNHTVPRDTAAIYRVRAVGRDGRFSAWALSGSVTPTGHGETIVLTSDHDRTKEVVYFFDHDSTYPILSSEGDETVRIHGADRQVVFMESEDRGIGWHTGITIARQLITGKGGHHILTPLLSLIRSLDVPYVVVLDDRGTHINGHVSMDDSQRQQFLAGGRPGYYTADIQVTPTHADPVPVEVS